MALLCTKRNATRERGSWIERDRRPPDRAGPSNDKSRRALVTLVKRALQLASAAASSVAAAFLFQWYVLTRLGPGGETDAFFAAMTIPQMVLGIITGSLVSVIVPILAGASGAEFRRNAWTLLFLVGGFFAIFSVFLFFFAPWWVPLTVPGFDAETTELTVRLARIQLFGMVFIAISGVQTAVYHAQNKFLWAEIVPGLCGLLGLIALVWALPRFGVTAAAVISSLRAVASSIFLVKQMGHLTSPNLSSPVVTLAWKRIKPLLLGSAYYNTDMVIDRFLLSGAAPGSVSIYHLAKQLYSASAQIAGRAIAVPAVPALSRLYKQGHHKDFRALYRKKLLHLTIIASLGIGFLGWQGKPLLGLLVGYGSMTEDHVVTLWWIMIWMAGMFAGGLLGSISANTFYARGDTVTPVRFGIYTYTFFVPVKILLFLKFGLAGIALSTSGFFLANAALQIFSMNKRFAQEIKNGGYSDQ